jgi:hypothetical protein
MKINQTCLLAIILAFATLYFYQDPQSNGNSRLDAARAIVEHGSFQIDTYLSQQSWASIDKAFYNGHYYTDKGIGSSLFAVPPYWVLYKLATALGIVLASDLIKHSLTFLVIGTSFVINGIILFKIALLISQNSWKAFIATLAVSLGTMLWPYSEVYYGHVPAAMFLTIAFYLLFSMKKPSETISTAKFFGTGLALGFAFLTDYTTSLIIAGLIIYAVYILRKQNPCAFLRYGFIGAIGALISLSLMFAYNFSVYGNILSISYTHEASIQALQGPPIGFWGFLGLPNLTDLSALYHITFDPKFGLFWQSPVLILAVIGYFLALKTKSFRAEALISLYSILSIFLMNAGIFEWWGGSAFGPRYLIVTLPFFILPLMLVPDTFIWIIGALTIVSAAQMLIPLMGKIQIGLDFDAAKNQFLVNGPFNGFSIIYNYGLPIIFKLKKKGTVPWTLGHAVGISFYRSPIILIVVEAFLISLFYRKSKAGSINKDV